MPELIAHVTTEMVPDPTQNLNQVPSSKCLETRDSISSIDSDVSLSFDEKHAEDEGAHMADLSDSASDTASTGGGKDSGCEVTPELSEPSEPSFTPPDDELADRIVQQVEFYFSDANITKDAFLLKHVKRNKEGYVSLKLVASFKRVKHLTKEWRVVACALARSTKLQINEAGTKLRRLAPLPKYDETTPSRTIVAVDLPLERPTIESVAELFRPCGDISLVRILRPGNPIPSDVRQLMNKRPSLVGVVCALVEFVASAGARAALQLPTSGHPNLKVYELNGVPQSDRSKKSKKTTRQVQTTANSTDVSSSEAEERFRVRARRSSSNYPSAQEPVAAWLQRRLSASSTEANFMYLPRRLSYSSSRDSSESSLFVPRRLSQGSYCLVMQPPPPSHELAYAYPSNSQRRISSGSETANGRPRSNSAACQNGQGENVLRMPKGPDGSRGFRQHRPSLGTIYS